MGYNLQLLEYRHGMAGLEATRDLAGKIGVDGHVRLWHRLDFAVLTTNTSTNTWPDWKDVR